MTSYRTRTFFDAPLFVNLDEITADVALLGVPFGNSNDVQRKTGLGPQAMRETNIYHYAGRPGKTPAVGYYDFDNDTDYLKGVTMVDCGDVPFDPLDVNASFAAVTATVGRILDRGAFPVVVGGGHAISAYS